MDANERIVAQVDHETPIGYRVFRKPPRDLFDYAPIETRCAGSSLWW